MNTVTRLGSVILSLTAAGVVLAQASPPAGSPSGSGMGAVEFSAVDTNKDGRVSADEARSHAPLNASFSMLDTDGDKYLSQGEFGKWKPGSSSSAPRPTSPGAAGTEPGSAHPEPAK